MCLPAWGRARMAAQRLSDLTRLRRVRDRIDRDYAQPLDVEALARGADVPAGHLSREFRLAYGTSPYAYLMARRIERAAVLLLHQGGPGVAEACRAVGCPSLGVFRTRFTELVGVPPHVYRHRARDLRRGMGVVAGAAAWIPGQATVRAGRDAVAAAGTGARL